MSDIPDGDNQAFNMPNFPPNYAAGQADVDWSTDLRVDPTGSTTLGKGWATPAPRTDEV
jgi:hypothetical protein